MENNTKTKQMQTKQAQTKKVQKEQTQSKQVQTKCKLCGEKMIGPEGSKVYHMACLEEYILEEHMKKIAHKPVKKCPWDSRGWHPNDEKRG